MQVAPEAHGACGQVFGMGGGIALAALRTGDLKSFGNRNYWEFRAGIFSVGNH